MVRQQASGRAEARRKEVHTRVEARVPLGLASLVRPRGTSGQQAPGREAGDFGAQQDPGHGDGMPQPRGESRLFRDSAEPIRLPQGDSENGFLASCHGLLVQPPPQACQLALNPHPRHPLELYVGSFSCTCLSQAYCFQLIWAHRLETATSPAEGGHLIRALTGLSVYKVGTGTGRGVSQSMGRSERRKARDAHFFIIGPQLGEGPKSSPGVRAVHWVCQDGLGQVMGRGRPGDLEERRGKRSGRHSAELSKVPTGRRSRADG